MNLIKGLASSNYIQNSRTRSGCMARILNGIRRVPFKRCLASDHWSCVESGSSGQLWHVDDALRREGLSTEFFPIG